MQVGSIILRPLQVETVNKLSGIESVLVGDGTGTGKTVTSVALLHQIWNGGDVDGMDSSCINGAGNSNMCAVNNGPTLIVTKSFNVWLEWLEKSGVDCGQLLGKVDVGSQSRVIVIDKKKRDAFVHALSFADDCSNGNRVYVMHWEALRLIPELLEVKWLCIIADEVHRASTRTSQQTKALKKLRTRYKIGISGTPGDNATTDIWSVLNWLYPKKYTSFWRFVGEYIECEKHWKGYTVFGGPIEEKIPQFRAEIEPFYAHGFDQDIPKPVYLEVHVSMTELQAQAYKNIVNAQMTYLGDDLLVTDNQLVLNTRLQQFAMAYGRIDLVTRWKTSESGHRIRVDKTSVRLEEPSSKLDQLMSILVGDRFYDEVSKSWKEIDADEPVVIFTQYRDVVRLACVRMSAVGISHVAVVGGGDTSADKAEKIFQSGQVRVIIGTVQTIGESITLTRSRISIFVDRHWNPRVNDQAEGRTPRIGQTRTPWMIDIKTRDTVDFVRLNKIRTKAEWLDAMFGRER